MTPKKRTLFRRYSILIFLLTVVLSAACSQKTAQKENNSAETLVEVSQPSSNLVREENEYLARFESRKSVTLSPRVDGQITAINAVSGDRVNAGQVLVKIEAARQEATVRSAQVQTESRRRAIDRAKSQISSLQADQTGRESNLKLAKIQLERTRSLQAKGVVSRQELDEAENNYQTAVANLSAANSRVQAQKAEIAQFQEDAKQADEMLSEEQAQLQYYEIIAPFGGVVGDIPVKVGDYVSPTTSLLTVTVNQPLEVYISIPVEKAAKLRVGLPLELIAPNGEELGTSRAFFVAPGAEGSEQTILLKAIYQNSARKIRVGEWGRARIVWSQDSGLWIPAKAVYRLAGQEFLFVAKRENERWVARQIPVRLGEPNNEVYPVIEGLRADDSVIVSGIQNLSDGAAVSIKD